MKRTSKTVSYALCSTILLVLFLFNPTVYAQEAGTADSATTQIRLVGQPVSPDGKATVILEMDTIGVENAVGFSFDFSADELGYEGYSGLAPGVVAFVNALVPGKIGFVLALPSGQVFTSGTRRVVSFNFLVKRPGKLYLRFSDTPARREVVNVRAEVLPAVFTDGFVFTDTPIVEFFFVGPTHAEVGKLAYVLVGGLEYADSAVVIATHWTGKWEVGEIKPGGEVERFVFVPPAGYTRFEVIPIKNGQRLPSITAMGVNRP